MAIGRISGSVLKSNLTRNGVDLAFETNLLYLDVTNSRVGIGTSEPATTFHVNGTIRGSGINVNNAYTLPTSDGSAGQQLTTDGSGTVTWADKDGSSDISITGNEIKTTTSNSSLELSANGSGQVEMQSNVLVKGGTPFVKIQRTDNANVPGIDFVGQADTSGAKILFDGTGGTANELIFQTFTVAGGLAEAFRVTGTGAKVSGLLTLPDGSVSDNYLGIGDADDLKIFHNGSHSIIRETGTGSLYIQSDNNVIIGKDSSSETMIKGVADGAVELYHDNTKKFETTANGVSVTGNLAADGSQIDFTSLPTSDPGVAGRLFRSGNDVKISTG